LGLKLITTPSSAEVKHDWKPPVCVYVVNRENVTCIYICVCVCVCVMSYLLQCLPVASLEKYEL